MTFSNRNLLGARCLGGLLATLFLMPLAGCGVVFHVADRVDADGDGFFALAPGEQIRTVDEDGNVTILISREELRLLNLDCDDEDDDIWPGAAELCDGLDNDCDANLADFEVDNDGDGFTECGFNPPADFTGDDPKDCNDVGDLGVFQNPGREEYCGHPLLNGMERFGYDPERPRRGIDDNCDGLLYDEDLGGREVDNDQDGHYDCEAHEMTPEATVPDEGDRLGIDCVDFDDGVHPSVDEADWRCTEYPVSGGIGDYDSACHEPDDPDYRSDTVTWYLDLDGDLDGDPGETREECQGVRPDGEGFIAPAPFGSAADGTLASGIEDCDDSSPGRNSLDLDSDGFSSCASPQPDFFNGVSFDNDSTVYPGAPESCDAKDNDLNGITDDGFDQDGDGSFTDPGNGSSGGDGCLAVEGGGYGVVDCDDSDPSKNENDVDNDGTTSCDTPADCDDGNPSISATDADGDGSTTCDTIPDCDDSNAALNNDDADNDGWTTCAGDCLDDPTNSLSAQVNPAQAAQCDGYFDTNCDTVFDPLEVDDDGDGTTECQGDCNDNDATLTGTDGDNDGFTSCTGDCDDGEPAAYPGAPAVCDSVTDNDCNGAVDPNEADLDGDGFTGCTTDVDCNDNDPTLNQADADSDGVTSCDGDCDDSDPAASPLIDADGDGWSTCPAGSAPADCNDDPTAGGAAENYTDADGDGDTTCGTDCNDLDPWANGLDTDGDNTTTCDSTPDCDDTDPAMSPSNNEPAAGTPDGIDNDCDGIVDGGQLDAGDIAIVEMLISGTGGGYGDGAAEFVELFSTRSDVDVDLRGMVVTVDNVVPDPGSPGSFTVDTITYTIPADPDPASALTVPATTGSIANATRVVLWRSGAVNGSDPAYPAATGLGYVWQGPLLSDLGGTIEISHGGVLLDSVDWYPSGCVSGCGGSNPVYDLDQDAGSALDRSPWRPGYSMGLASLSGASASTNDSPDNWCEEQSVANTNLHGSPTAPPTTALRVCP